MTLSLAALGGLAGRVTREGAAALLLRADRVRAGQILDLRVRRGAQVFDTRLEAIRPPDGIQAACARP